MQLLGKKDRLRNKSKNYFLALYLGVIIFFICIIIKIVHIVYFAKAPTDELPNIIFVDILDAVIGAILGILGIDLLYQKRAEQDIENDTAANIISVLVSKDKEDTHPRLYELYNKKAVENVLSRVIESYCASEKMAHLYLSYIKKSCQLVKYNETYNIKISRTNNCDNTQTTYIEQYLKETRMFKPSNNTNIGLFSFFVFKKGSEIGNNNKLLDEKLKDDKYFMREELCNSMFVDSLIAIDKENCSDCDKHIKILNTLNYKVQLFNPTTNSAIDSSRISYICSFVKDENGKYLGLEVSTPLPDDVISPAELFYTEENFKRYTAALKFKYAAPLKVNEFYVVYSAPTINSEFELVFENFPHDHCKNISYMPFLSFAQEENTDIAYSNIKDGSIRLHSSVLSFKTQRTILPRSGISIFWEN